ncbi:MAG: esterase-like activity of phytase family protein [Arenimonas sp.]
MNRLSTLICIALFSTGANASQWSLVNIVQTPATKTDALKLSKHGDEQAGANMNRFGFYSDLVYDKTSNRWLALSDRGPGGGVIDYATRVQKIIVQTNRNTAVINEPIVNKTILLKDANGVLLNGLNPQLLNGDKSVLGASFDPEGIALGSNGNIYIADEYGPSVFEFDRNGQMVRRFETPANLIPTEANGTRNYVDGRPVVVSGRQDNRGFEGLTVNSSGTKLYAVMQDPLVNEGSSNDGRRSRNVRIVEFDIASGQSNAQYVYQLESRIQLNAIDPGTADDFSATNQGRSIGLSAIAALSDTEFLVLERDNRGLGVELTAAPIHKRIYRINLQGATNVKDISLAGSDALPANVVAVQKSAEHDLLADLKVRGITVPEKMEGLAIGPRLADGRFLVLVGTDNDYSVTQTGSGEQFDVCVDPITNARTQVALDVGCPAGSALIPGYLMSYAVDFGN